MIEAKQRKLNLNDLAIAWKLTEHTMQAASPSH
jgi:hypothetical protein